MAWNAQLLPDKTVAVLLYLAPHQRASRSARSTPSTLKLDFIVDESAPSTGAVEEVSDSHSWPPGILPSPPPVPAQVDARGGAILCLILALLQIVSHLLGSCSRCSCKYLGCCIRSTACITCPR